MNETPKTVYDVSHVRNTGSPKWGDPYGDGASIVVVGVTTLRGEWENHSQGEVRQVGYLK